MLLSLRWQEHILQSADQKFCQNFLKREGLALENSLDALCRSTLLLPSGPTLRIKVS